MEKYVYLHNKDGNAWDLQLSSSSVFIKDVPHVEDAPWGHLS